MDEPFFPYPHPEPLKRLHVYDSLPINAQRWSLAHDYHRQRQNLHYQSLYQPGIVYGLGVKLIAPPPESSSQYRRQDEEAQENRWLEIQPGIAIDLAGNPIIVNPEEDRTYRIAAIPKAIETLTVYVVLSYVEPETLEISPTQLTIPERFRLDQITSPPEKHQIEICRIELGQPVSLEFPANPFAPDVNQINLNHRPYIQYRPNAHVTIGAIGRIPSYIHENFAYLIQALQANYPALQANLLEQPIQYAEDCEKCQIIYCLGQDFIDFTDSELQPIRNLVQSGKTLLVESGTITQTSQKGTLLSNKLQKILDEPLEDWEECSTDHPLRTKPFLFTSLPFSHILRIQTSASGGVILVKGSLSELWGTYSELTRGEIRAAHELGINLLHFAWQYAQLKQLCHTQE